MNTESRRTQAANEQRILDWVGDGLAKAQAERVERICEPPLGMKANTMESCLDVFFLPADLFLLLNLLQGGRE